MAYTETLQRLAANLTTTFKNTIFSHPGDIGDSREKAVIDYLRKVMPRRYGFHSGEVFDMNDDYSGQIDVIIHDDLYSTVFTDGSEKILAPIESTFGLISVKSKMGTRELDDAINGVKRYNCLIRTPPKPDTIYLRPDLPFSGGQSLQVGQPPQQNINCIFAFDTTVAIETLISKVKTAGCIDLLVIPGKMLIIGRRRRELGFTIHKGEPLFNAAFLGETSVPLFIVVLQNYLSSNHLVARDTTSLAVWLARQCKTARLP